MTNYHEFLIRKSQLLGESGFDPVLMPRLVFDFQKAIVTWALKTCRATILADCSVVK